MMLKSQVGRLFGQWILDGIDNGGGHQIRDQQPLHWQRRHFHLDNLALQPVAVGVADNQAVEHILLMLPGGVGDVRRGDAGLGVDIDSVHGEEIFRHDRNLHIQ